MRYTQLIPELVDDKPDEEHYQVLEIRANNVIIPPQKTTYWCKSFKLSPDLIEKKHHIVKVRLFNIINKLY